MKRSASFLSLLLIGGAASAIAYKVFLRERVLSWGTTADEQCRRWPGDERMPAPRWSFTHAVTVRAPAEAVWPWVQQIGYGRGGFYSYDFIDRAMGAEGMESAQRILPEFQNLAVGDRIALAEEMDVPVVQLEPERALVLEAEGQPEAPGAPADPAAPSYMHIVWAWLLEPAAEGTRLLSRAHLDYNPSFGNRVMHALLPPFSFIMDWGMLQGIKRRAEKTHAGS